MKKTEETEFGPTRSALIAAGGVIFATYFYFLIFAEFALLELARPILGEETWRLRGLLFSLGVGGVAGSVWGAWKFNIYRWQRQLSWALRGCAVGAVLALSGAVWPILLLAAGISGVALGALTVILATGLRSTIGTRRLGWVIGWGTGFAYAMGNVPMIFEASARFQTGLAAVVIAAASVLSPFLAAQEPSTLDQGDYAPAGVLRWIGILLMLVWLDSAVFYLIQHHAEFQRETWSGPGHLWANAAIHLLLAVGAGWALDRGARIAVVAAGFVLLATGTLMLGGSAGAGAGVVYAAGVSLYSVVLVYYPARSGRGWVACSVYAVAGWLGSALGIGMAQDLAAVPLGFLGVSAAVILMMGVWRWRALRLVTLVIGLGMVMGLPQGLASTNAAELRGREVYIAEGCIHCHSQYVRPGTVDEERWGPAQESVGLPPLVGNRRQGPDLTTVGVRLPADWHRQHLMAPRQFKPGSRMPSYAYLFSGDANRGEDLVAYLMSLGQEEEGE